MREVSLHVPARDGAMSVFAPANRASEGVNSAATEVNQDTSMQMSSVNSEVV